MTITDVFQKLTAGELAGWAATALILLLSLIQVSPIKLNPWDNIFGWIGKKTNGATEKRLSDLEKQTREMWINQHRQSILTFSRECRAGVQHDSEEWANCLNQCATYEAFIKEKNYPNGIVQSNIDYVRNLYQELSREHKI